MSKKWLLVRILKKYFKFNYVFKKNSNKLILSQTLFGNLGVDMDVNLEKNLGDGYGDLLSYKNKVEITSAQMYEAVCDMVADRFVNYLSRSLVIKSNITNNLRLRDFISGYIGVALKNNGRGGLGTYKIYKGEENYFRLYDENH